MCARIAALGLVRWYVLLIQQVVGESNPSLVGRSVSIHVIAEVVVRNGQLLLQHNHIRIFLQKYISSLFLRLCVCFIHSQTRLQVIYM